MKSAALLAIVAIASFLAAGAGVSVSAAAADSSEEYDWPDDYGVDIELFVPGPPKVSWQL